MPKYKKIVADSHKKAMEMVEQEFGTRDVTVLRESKQVVKGKKKSLFGKKDRVEYVMEVAQYNSRVLNFNPVASLDDAREKKSREVFEKDSKRKGAEKKPFSKVDVQALLQAKSKKLKEGSQLEFASRKKKVEVQKINLNFKKEIDRSLANKSSASTVSEFDKSQLQLMIEDIQKLRKQDVEVSKTIEMVEDGMVGNISTGAETTVLSRTTAIPKKSELTDVVVGGNSEFSGYLNEVFKRRDEKEVLADIQEQTGLRSATNKLYDFLIERSFSDRLAKIIVGEFGKNFSHTSKECKELTNCIASLFKFAGKVKVSSDLVNLIFLVGPTGVGKTTTLTKLSSGFLANQSNTENRIKIASFDMKRMMAMDQMAAFAKILKTEFRRIFNLKELEVFYQDARPGDVLMMDTSGVSIKEVDDIEEIAEFVNYHKQLENANSSRCRFSKKVMLCVNSNMRYYDLKKIMKEFEVMNYDQLIITKQDESYSLGSVLSVAYDFGLPLSYLTNGQEVPKAICTLDKELLEKMLLAEWS